MGITDTQSYSWVMRGVFFDALVAAPFFQSIYPANIFTALTRATVSGVIQVTATTTTPHGLNVGSAFASSGNTPAAYDGTFTAVAGTTGSTIVWNLASSVADPGAIAVLGQLDAGGFFRAARKQKQMPVQQQLVPYLGVYFVDEPHVPDGDLNHGEIKFIHSCRIGISVIIENNDPDTSEAKLDQAYWAIMNRLWTDEYIMNMIDTKNYATGTENPDNTRAEGVERIRRRHVFGNAQLNNEKPLAELQMDITIRLRTRWPAVVTDDFEHIHFEARPVVGYYPPPANLDTDVAPVVAEWDMQTIEESIDYSEPPERGSMTDPPP